MIGLAINNALKTLVSADCNSIFYRVSTFFQFAAGQHHMFRIHESCIFVVLKDLCVEVETGAASDKDVLKVQ